MGYGGGGHGSGVGVTINVSRFNENSHGLTTGNRDGKNNSDRCMR